MNPPIQRLHSLKPFLLDSVMQWCAVHHLTPLLLVEPDEHDLIPDHARPKPLHPRPNSSGTSDPSLLSRAPSFSASFVKDTPAPGVLSYGQHVLKTLRGAMGRDETAEPSNKGRHNGASSPSLMNGHDTLDDDGGLMEDPSFDTARSHDLSLERRANPLAATSYEHLVAFNIGRQAITNKDMSTMALSFDTHFPKQSRLERVRLGVSSWRCVLIKEIEQEIDLSFVEELDDIQHPWPRGICLMVSGKTPFAVVLPPPEERVQPVSEHHEGANQRSWQGPERRKQRGKLSLVWSKDALNDGQLP